MDKTGFWKDSVAEAVDEIFKNSIRVSDEVMKCK